MARDIMVHTGVADGGTPQERPSAWVEIAIPLQLEAHELADGLGSRFLRYLGEGESGVGDRPDEIPLEIKQAEILKIYRSEFSYWGINLSTWGDTMTTDQRAAHVGWLLEVVLNAFPAMRGYEVR